MVGDVVSTVYGPMSAEFAKSPLGDLCVPDGGVQTGPFGSQLHSSDYVECGTPIITVEHLGENRIIHKNLPRVTDEDKKRLERYTLITGDIVFSRVGSVDRRAIVHPEEDGWLFSGRCLRVRPDRKKIDPGFLSWFFGLPTFQEHIRQIAVGATMPSLNTKILGDVAIYYPPPLKHQQAIACILGALDDKIELNRQLNRTLEEMARAIFKSWFVNFDPVRAKAAGQQPPGLKPEIAALFPDSFEESELGEIPKGWRVGRLGDLVENVIKRVQPSAYTESIPYVPIECIDSRTVCLSNSQPGEKARSSLTCFQEGDILFGAMRPYFHKVCIAPFEGTTRTTAFILRPKATELAYAALVISRDETIDYATAHSEGSTIPYAKWAESLQDMRIIIPPQGLRCSFHRYVWPFIQRMMVSVSDNKTLAELRDTLLPKLISGELRLPDAERIAGRLL